jgi:cytosine deaminase
VGALLVCRSTDPSSTVGVGGAVANVAAARSSLDTAAPASSVVNSAGGLAVAAMTHAMMATLVAAAREQAELSWEQGGVPVGAVIATDAGQIVARGHNCRHQNGDPTSHGETQCIRNAGRRRDWHKLTLVTTLSPCPMCAGTAVLLRFKRVVIGERASFQGPEQWLVDAGIEVQCLDDLPCVALMSKMLDERPDLWAEDIGDP